MHKRLAALLALLAVAAVGVGGWYVWQRRQPEYILGQAKGALEKGDRREAERFASLLEQRDDRDAAHWIRGKAAYDEGREYVDRASKSGHLDSVQMLSSFLFDCGGPLGDPVHPPILFQNYRSIFLSLSRRPWLRERLQLEARGQSSRQQAIQQFSQIGRDHPLFADGAAYMGECFYHLKDIKQATALLSFAVKEQPDNVEAHRWLAVIHFDQGSMFPALDHLQEVARLDPEDGRPHRQMGLIHKDYSKFGEAIRDYQEALKRNLKPPVVAEVVRELAELQAGQGQYEAAMETLKKCPDDFSGRPEYRALRADCLFYGLQQPEEAVKLVESALRENPDVIHALVLRARMHLDMGKHADALPLLERALRLDDIDEKTLDKMAQAYNGIGDAKKAQEFSKRRDEVQRLKTQLTDQNASAMSRPLDDKLRVEIAQTWLKLGRKPEARMWLEAALGANSKNEEAQRLMREIR